ncbi:MAG: exodeoxyribonuclease VII small subunit [Hahellaceae bacterium]|nr:exodeoxyribonuclease VII small subunit [Hahellaceae bacterium]MCP5169873.1 exodeoxyribonuclease VII small subunit [Hahellaceae bacterium]
MSNQAPLNFEQSLEALESLIQQMEKGELSLEDSLAAFERGIKLTRECQTALTQAKQRVDQLLQNSDGSISTEPFNRPDTSN